MLCQAVGNFVRRRAAAAYNALLYSSYIDGNEGNNAMQNMLGLYNCTVGPNNTSGGTAYVAIYTQGEPLVNCAFLGWVYGSDVMKAYNCKFLKGNMPATYVTMENCEVFESVSEFGLDDEARPISESSPLVDGCMGEYAYDGSNYNVDAGGGKRVYNGAMDIGCFEYDWRPKYSSLLGVRVAEASAGVMALEDALVIPANEKVKIEWANGYGKPKRSSFQAEVSEGAVLAVECDGTDLVSFGPGKDNFSYECGSAGDTLDFSCTGIGSAAISSFVRGRGFGIVVR